VFYNSCLKTFGSHLVFIDIYSFNNQPDAADAAVCSQFYFTARFTLHVSVVLHTHHQEYNSNCIYSLRYKSYCKVQRQFIREVDNTLQYGLYRRL